MIFCVFFEFILNNLNAAIAASTNAIVISAVATTWNDLIKNDSFKTLLPKVGR